MTAEPDHKPERSRTRRGGLWVNDAELIERLGVPENDARKVIRKLDEDAASGFPKKQALWNDRRYWPAVEAYFEHLYGFRASARQAPERVPPRHVGAVDNRKPRIVQFDR